MSKEHNINTLKEALTHIKYEVWMMNSLANILENSENLFESKFTSYTTTTELKTKNSFLDKITTTNEKTNNLHAINNALIEAFGVHTRSLLDFFYLKEKKDDILAGHFFENSKTWEKARPQKSQEDIQSLRSRVNKEIAHLTYIRLTTELRPWPFTEIQSDLNKAFDIFTGLTSQFLSKNH